MRSNKDFYVYILTNRSGSTYIGMTSNLMQRVWQHREGLVPGYTRERNIKRLVFYEMVEEAQAAVARERQLKKWNRARKTKLVQGMNPTWRDLYPGLISGVVTPPAGIRA